MNLLKYVEWGRIADMILHHDKVNMYFGNNRDAMYGPKNVEYMGVFQGTCSYDWAVENGIVGQLQQEYRATVGDIGDVVLFTVLERDGERVMPHELVFELDDLFTVSAIAYHKE